jgi:hypothetical protein
MLAPLDSSKQQHKIRPDGVAAPVAICSRVALPPVRTCKIDPRAAICSRHLTLVFGSG